MHDLRHDPDAIDPDAERTAYMRQWQPVAPDAPRTNTELHMPDGGRFTNIAVPRGMAPTIPTNIPVPAWQIDLRDAGERLGELASAVEAERIHLRLLLQRVEALERALAGRAGA